MIRFRPTPALALLFLAPFIGEVLSGSSPPLELLNPLAVLFMIGLYGCGALLVRELAFRWKKGWLAIFILGASYGIFEEGLMTKSFFDPGWMDVGLLGSYGRFLGINWIWTVELILFHSVFSIAASILLVWLAFPEWRDRPWLSLRAMAVCGVIFLAIIPIGYFFMTPYRPEMPIYLGAIIAAIALIGLAWLLPSQILLLKNHGAPLRPRWLFLLGLGWTIMLFITVWIIPGTGISPVMPLVILIFLGIAGLLLVAWMYGNGGMFAETHKLALTAGGLSVFILFSIVLEISGIRGMSLAGATGAIMILLLWRKLTRASPEGVRE